MPGSIMRKARVRPDPVSCQSCRSKKLKCNRIKPCSNCTARNITCNFLISPHHTVENPSPAVSNAELLARIEKLESIILKQRDTFTSSLNQVSTGNRTSGASLDRHAFSNLECPRTAILRRQEDHDSRQLESVGTRDDCVLPSLSNGGWSCQVQNLEEILVTSSAIQNQERSKDLVTKFPPYGAAKVLLQSYELTVDHLCCILHIPTVRSLITTFYLHIGEIEHVVPGQAALLLSIFAIAAYFYQPSEKSEIATTKRDAILISKMMSKSALDVLDYSRRTTSGTLEDIQAYILMSFVAYHLDGFSARGRFFLTAATSIARDLRLHRLDSDLELAASMDPSDIRTLIDREVRRRVFWQIASTDWMFSFMSGPQEGMYFIHPNHVEVNVPKDCTDDNIWDLQSESVSSVQPTRMTFFLARLRLANLCREMADAVPPNISKLLEIPYEQIIALDQKLQYFMDSLPFYYKSDDESLKRSKPLETIFPKIPVSRHCITTEAHIRRCKLHQRFLLRQSVDARYAYSRRACLESARSVVQAFVEFQQHDSLSTPPEFMGIALHSVYLALLVMAMDLCFNKNEPDQNELSGEMTAALQMLKGIENPSPLLNRFSSSLNNVLTTHNVQLPDPSHTHEGLTQEVMLDILSHPQGGDYMQYDHLGLGDPDSNDFALDTSFDEFWQAAMQDESSSDSRTWDNLFSAFDSRPF